MASTPSNDELLATIAALRAENARLQRESADVYARFALANGDLIEALGQIDNLRTRIRTLLDYIPAGALPAPTLFSDPRTVPGSDSDGAAHGGGPPVARSRTSNGPPLYRGLPALGPSASVMGPCTGNRISEPSDENRLVVSAIPSLHRTYANLSPTGHWRYWREVPGGYVWDPKWIEDDE